MGCTRIWTTLAWGLVLSAALSAQTRKPMFGRVVDTDGKSVAGAAVTLFWTPPGDGTGAQTDRVAVVTDERGRFVAQLRTQVGYSAFASGAVGSDGSQPVSEMRDVVAAGADVELVLSRTAKGCAVGLRHCEAWAAEGPLRLFALPRAQNLFLVEVPLRSGGGMVPPLPALAALAVVDQHGVMLWVYHCKGDDVPEVIELPAPEKLLMRVVDDKDTPLASVALAHSVGELVPGLTLLRAPTSLVWRQIGVTGADGTALVRVAGDSVDAFSASAPGFAESGCYGSSLLKQKEAERTLKLTLTREPRVRLLVDGKPLVRHPVTVATTVRLTRFDTDADGWLPVHTGMGECTLFPDPIEMAAGARESPRVWPIATIAKVIGGEAIDLARLRKFSVQVLREDGGPARGVPMFLIEHGPWMFRGAPICTDQAGRVDLRVGLGNWLLFLLDGDQCVWRSILEADQPQDMQLTMVSLPRLRCRIVDVDSKPIAGAKVVESQGTFPGNHAYEGEEAVLRVIRTMNAHALFHGRVSDARGALDLPFFPKEGESLRVVIGKGRQRSVEAPMLVASEGERLDVVLR